MTLSTNSTPKLQLIQMLVRLILLSTFQIPTWTLSILKGPLQTVMDTCAVAPMLVIQLNPVMLLQVNGVAQSATFPFKHSKACCLTLKQTSSQICSFGLEITPHTTFGTTQLKKLRTTRLQLPNKLKLTLLIQT